MRRGGGCPMNEVHFRKADKSRRTTPWAVVAAITLIAVGAAVMYAMACSPSSAAAQGRPNVGGVCQVTCANPGLGDDDSNLFDVVMPDGQVLRGYCLDHGQAAPADGTYAFTGEWDGGAYAVRVHTEGAEPYPGQIFYGACQAVGGFSWTPSGSLTVEKASSLPGLSAGNGCYSLAGAVFEVRDASGALVGSITTDAEGRGSLGGLPQGTYTVREVSSPAGFALNGDELSVDVVAGAATVAVEDVPQRAEVEVVVAKYDAELGFSDAGNEPQGEASLAGAEFEVAFYGGFFESAEEAAASGDPLRTWVLRTGEDGTAKLSGECLVSGDALYRDEFGAAVLPLGTVCVREIKAPEGYLLDSGGETVCVCVRPGEAGQIAARYHAPAVANRVIRGDVSLVKFGNAQGTAGDSALKQPLAGVSFDIVHASTGMVAARITTDDRGFASTTDAAGDGGGALPYGTYLVREDASTAPAGYAVVPEFPVVVTEDGRTYSYLVEDSTGTAIRVVKQDAETGRQVPRSTTFRILDADMNVVSFTSVYPSVAVHTAFTTDATGACVLPERLNGGGTYYVQEVSAPEGYVLSSEPVAFTLSDGGADFSNPVTVVLSDMPQKGRLELQKTDASSGCAVPAAGVTWEVRAKEDVVTPDGTVRAQAGDLVASLESDENGRAAVEGLYLGVYEVRETAAPAGYLLAEEALTVELSYAGQDVVQAVTSVSFADAPATGDVRISKADALTGAPVAGARFDVVAAEDVVTPDGALRVRRGDVAASVETSEDGRACAEGLFPGRYEVVEAQPAPGYVPDGVRHAVEVRLEESGQACETVELEVENMPNRVDVTKVDARTGEPLAGAVIGWWNRCDEQAEPFSGCIEVIGERGGLAYVDEALMGCVVTDGEGLASVERLAQGTYAFAELAAPEGYELDAAPQELEVADDGSIAGEAAAALVFEDDELPEPQEPAVALSRTGDPLARALATLGAAACLSGAAVAYVLHRERRARRAS